MNCSLCGYANRASTNQCARCGGPLGAAEPAPATWVEEDRTMARPVVSRDVGTSAGLPEAQVQSDAPAAWPAFEAHSPAPDPVPAPPGQQGSGPAFAGDWPDAPLRPAPPSSPPASVRRIKALAYTVAVLGLVSTITSLFVGLSGAIQSLAGIVGIVAYIFLAFQVEARKNWARIVIGVLAIAGVLGDLFSVVSVLGVLAFLEGMIGGDYVVAAVFGAVLAVVGAVILALLAVSALGRDAAAWCTPTSPTGR